MKKTLLTIDDDLLDFLRSDAAKERRSMSAQICVLLELCKKCGGYSGLIEKVTINNLQPEASGKGPAKPIGRPRKPGIITEEFSGLSLCALKLYNKRKKKGLIIKYGNNYRKAAKYIRESLETGTFPREDVQRDFTEDCDSFVIRDAVGDTMDDVFKNCENQGCVLYDGWLDLGDELDGSETVNSSGNKSGQRDQRKAGVSESHTAKPQNTNKSAPNNQSEQDASPDRNSSKRQKTLDEIMSVEWDDVSVDDAKAEFKKVCSNVEVKDAARRYISECYPDNPKMRLSSLKASDILNIMQDLQQEYYSNQREQAGTVRGKVASNNSIWAQWAAGGHDDR